MRVKQIWYYVPVPAKLKLFWERINVSRITLFYFVFSILHCILQVVFQVQAFSINANAATFLYGLIEQGNATVPGFFVLGRDLRYCDQPPNTLSARTCQQVWAGTSASNSTQDGVYAAVNHAALAAQSSVTSNVVSTISSAQTVPTSSASSAASSTVSITSSNPASSSSPDSFSSTASPATNSSSVTELSQTTVTAAAKVTQVVVKVVTTTVSHQTAPSKLKRHDGSTFEPVRSLQTTGQTPVTLHGSGFNGQTVTLDNKCLTSLNWAVQLLDNTKREDITFIAFQFWVLGMSVVAVLNESIPHIIAALLTHLSATAWGGFQVHDTTVFHADFKRLTTDGVCNMNLLPNYWTARGRAEIPALALNAAAVLLSIFLSWKLIKTYGWQTFKRIGASFTINRVYKLVLSLSIAIQLSLFFIVAAVGLWIDQICNGFIGHLAHKSTLYKVLLIIVLVLLVPWLIMGWIAVRRELNMPMMAFLVLSLLYIAGLGAMFDSTTFRWTFVQWRFFSVIISLSAALALIAFGLGLACRLNFGKGLPRYLNAQEELPGDDFVPVTPHGLGVQDPEKVDFPSNDSPIPTFSAAFGSGSEVPPPSQMKFAPRQMGPRFNDPSAEPFEQLRVDIPAPPLARQGSSPNSTSPMARYGSPTYARSLTRHGTQASQSSFASMTSSNVSHSTGGSSPGSSEGTIGGRMRWVIE
ncbi:hypothetical protein EVG20_g1872 [Dentipellis fragilis]|uniref:Uncharacterized protein n=1 Tax=Dentipellis fragilis TaxID=205917 RepID=A0A4Y9ZAF6_9AGAM|nr:hypothetical protein EVG20_g1872 [Dentipellis fragilis]